MNEAARALILQIGSSLTRDDYVFTVEACGSSWDVYAFSGRFVGRAGKSGMIAFRAVNGQAEIGFFRVGWFTPSQVAHALADGQPS